MRSAWWVVLVGACSVDIDYERVNVTLDPFAPALPGAGENIRTARGSLLVGEQSFSTDSGVTWKPISPDVDRFRAAFALSETEVLVQDFGRQLARWDLTNPPVQVSLPFSPDGYGASRNGTAFAWGNSGSLVIARQARGEAATQVTLPPGGNGGNFLVHEVASSTTLVVLMTSHGVYRSTDEGASWTFVVQPPVTIGQPRRVIALDDGRFIAFDNVGAGRVLDATGIPTGDVTPPFTGPINACLGALIVGTQYSTDLGQTFTPLFPASTGIDVSSTACSGTALLANLSVNGTTRLARYTAFDTAAQVLAVTAGGMIAGMVVASDGTLLANQLGWKQGESGWSLRVMPPGTLYALGDNSLLVVSPQGVHRSRDNGVTFKTVAMTMPPPVFQRAFVDSSGTLWASNRTDNAAQLYTSSDEGASWTPVPSAGGITPFVIAITENDTFVATSGSSGLHVSNDRAATWTALPFPGGYQLLQITRGGSAVTVGPADSPDTGTVWHLWRDHGLGSAYEQVTATIAGVTTDLTTLGREAQLDADDRAIVLTPTGIVRTSAPLR